MLAWHAEERLRLASLLIFALVWPWLLAVAAEKPAAGQAVAETGPPPAGRHSGTERQQALRAPAEHADARQPAAEARPPDAETEADAGVSLRAFREAAGLPFDDEDPPLPPGYQLHRLHRDTEAPIGDAEPAPEPM